MYMYNVGLGTEAIHVHLPPSLPLLPPSFLPLHTVQLQDSPLALTEKEFLMCNNTTLTGADDEYYSLVPEDNTVLDNSLSSSLTSLCHPTRDVEAPKIAEVL